MINLANEITRELPASPITFGVITFAIFSALLYLVLRLDR
jgi:hypothetical protein